MRAQMVLGDVYVRRAKVTKSQEEDRWQRESDAVRWALFVMSRRRKERERDRKLCVVFRRQADEPSSNPIAST